MQSWPLVVSSLLRHAERYHADTAVVSRRVEGDLYRYTYAALASRARRLAKATLALGIGDSDRVATLAWNGYRHLELYFAVAGCGGVLHTMNPRLHPDQLVYIADHAEDRAVFFDLSFVPIIEAIASRTQTVRHWIAMTDRAHMPQSSNVNSLLCFEDLLDAQDDRYDWPVLDENCAAGLCYTSGTTGNPKGVLFSHRSTVLHTYSVALPDSLSCSARDTILPVVPMFHVNAWGIAHAACMAGAKLVFPGPALDGKSLYELFEAEGVTFAAGVPTVWQGLLSHLETHGLRFSTLRRTAIGGSACPPSMLAAFQDVYGVEATHAWGMTEMSPLGTVSRLKAKHLGLPAEQQRRILATQGRPVFGVDLKIVDDSGAELPRDGTAAGNLLARGPGVLAHYFRDPDHDPLVDGWFPTGDVATLDIDGYIQITDRSKDVIKSGGEWIGSIDLENIAMAHPQVAMAACVAVPHPKWDERPLLVVVRKPGASLTRDELIQFYAGKVARWWTPDDVVFVESIPLGATGKMLKSRLREQFKDYRLPAA